MSELGFRFGRTRMRVQNNSSCAVTILVIRDDAPMAEEVGSVGPARSAVLRVLRPIAGCTVRILVHPIGAWTVCISYPLSVGAEQELQLAVETPLQASTLSVIDKSRKGAAPRHRRTNASNTQSGGTDR